MTRSRVDLPQPVGPTTLIVSPRRIQRLALFRATWRLFQPAGYALVRRMRWISLLVVSGARYSTTPLLSQEIRERAGKMSHIVTGHIVRTAAIAEGGRDLAAYLGGQGTAPIQP